MGIYGHLYQTEQDLKSVIQIKQRNISSEYNSYNKKLVLVFLFYQYIFYAFIETKFVILKF